MDAKEIVWEVVAWIHVHVVRGGLLCRRYGTFRFHEMRGNSWL